MSVDTLKEFLVKVGFKVDNASFKNFKKNINLADAATFAFGETLYDVSKKVEQFVVDSSVNLEKLYFASQRVGSSASSIKGFEFAVSRLGGTADDARSAMEGIGNFLRRNPGGGKYLEALGVDSKNVGNAAATLKDLEKSFSKLPIQLRLLYGESIGLNDKVIMSLDKVNKYQTQYNDVLKAYGLDVNTATDLSNKFNDKLFLVGSTIEAIGISLFGKLEPSGELIEKLISDVLKLGSAITSLKPVGVFFEGLGATLDLLVSSLDLAVKLLTDIANLDFTAFKKDFVGGLADLGSIFKGHSNKVADIVGMPRTDGTAPGTGPGGTPAAAGTVEQRTARAMAYFENMGWSPAQAAGIVAQGLSETGLQIHGKLGDGGLAAELFQWHPDRQANFQTVFHKSLKDATFEEQLAFKQYELTQGTEKAAGNMLRQATTPYQAGYIESYYDQRAGGKYNNRDYEATLRGNLASQVMSGATLNQTTNINVNGGGNANDVASAVGRQQTQVNNHLIRNVMGNVQ